MTNPECRYELNYDRRTLQKNGFPTKYKCVGVYQVDFKSSLFLKQATRFKI